MESKQKALVFGAGGFIGSHLVKRLKKEGYYVYGVDLKYPEFSTSPADEFQIGDLRDQLLCSHLIAQEHYDEIYQLAADMGGAGFVFTGENDADILLNNAKINLNLLTALKIKGKYTKVFYSSSACIYPQQLQRTPKGAWLKEQDAYPANPDSDYGWEKLISERMYQACVRNFGYRVVIARYHNIFGPEGAWRGGREKAPAALCRKVAEAKLMGENEVEIWGDGNQRRSFLYIDECIDGTRQMMLELEREPQINGKAINLGSDYSISINDLLCYLWRYAGLELNKLTIRHNCKMPQGVRGRSSDNEYIRMLTGWQPNSYPWSGLAKTYDWIEEQVIKEKEAIT